ncbi:hypothetical protein [Tamaricihabitans halophyticus]|uniref:hypothetical protein n=1 Tax=Tamaricihabitans halophyticus TaxID=1262583 RepID=UPI001FB3709D|nr:hypothetical protein [Tamaricihabitans halophyticus]
MPRPSLSRKSKRTADRADSPTSLGRHRSSTLETNESVPDQELESYLAALAPESDTETTDTGGRFGTPQSFRLRLTPIAGEQLRELAAAYDTTPEALLKDWVLQRLAWEVQPAPSR